MAKNGYDQTYENDRLQNEEDKDLLPRAGRAIAGAAGKAKDYVVEKIKGMDQRSLEQVAKDTLGNMDQRSLKEVTTDKMDQRSLEDVFKGKPPKYKEPAKKMAKGGSASARADGCCIRGKTRA
jgi:hypothetical protein